MRTLKRAATSKLAYISSLGLRRCVKQFLLRLPLRMSASLLLEIWRWAVTVLLILYMFGFLFFD